MPRGQTCGSDKRPPESCIQESSLTYGNCTQRQKTNYDQHARKHSYHVNEEVWLHNPVVPRGLSRKFHRPWWGPFKIVERLSEVLYKIQQINNPKRQCTVHFNRLKPFNRRSKPRGATSPLLHIPAHITARSTTRPDSPDRNSSSSDDIDSDTLSEQPETRSPSTSDSENPDTFESQPCVLRRSTRQSPCTFTLCLCIDQYSI